MKFNLEQWRDHTMLIHWDNMHGQDILFQLREDGTVWENTRYDEEKDEVIYTPVHDFVERLKELAIK